MHVSYHDIPNEVIEEYNLQNKVHQGYIYVEICKGMYVLKETGSISFKRLEKNMDPMVTYLFNTYRDYGSIHLSLTHPP